MKKRVILGGPGCGKTTTLLNLVREKLQSGYEPEEIAYLAFTRRAAYEARERAVQDLAINPERLVWFRTLHSLAFKTLGLSPGQVMDRKHYSELGEFLGLKFQSNKIDYDYGLHVGASEGEILARLEQLARVTNQDISRLAYYNFVDPFKARHYKRALQIYKYERGLIDFTDMIQKFTREVNNSIQIVIVDEAQDLSPIHWQALNSLFQTAREIFICGDDDQAIFQWAGADVERFLNCYGEKIVLPVSYRLPKKLFYYSQRIGKRIQRRYTKEFRPIDSDGFLRKIDHVEAVALGDEETALFLARHNYQLKKFIQFLRRQGHLYECYGKSSTDTKHVENILSWEALRNGKSITKAQSHELLRVVHPTVRGSCNLEDKPRYVKNDFSGVITAWLPWYEALIIPRHEEQYYRNCLRKQRRLNDRPKIKVSTIHGSKGGEADTVVVSPDISRAAQHELRTPSTRDNEHRVFYTAITRARRNLYILYPTGGRYYDL